MQTRKLVLLIAAGLASAALSYFGTGLHPIWWMPWLAPVPVLAIAPRLRSSAAFLLGFAAWLIGEMNQWNYLRHVIELPLQTIILFLVISAAVFGLGVLFTRSFLRRDSLFLAAFAFPAYWVTCEYLAAMVISFDNLLKILPRFASIAPLNRLTFDHLLCPAIPADFVQLLIETCEFPNNTSPREWLARKGN